MAVGEIVQGRELIREDYVQKENHVALTGFDLGLCWNIQTEVGSHHRNYHNRHLPRSDSLRSFLGATCFVKEKTRRARSIGY